MSTIENIFFAKVLSIFLAKHNENTSAKKIENTFKAYKIVPSSSNQINWISIKHIYISAHSMDKVYDWYIVKKVYN